MNITKDRQLAHLPGSQILSALTAAETFLGRWDDGFTRSNRDEISQEAVLESLSRWDELRDKRKFHGYVRTIARRQRAMALREHFRHRMLSIDSDWRLREMPAEPSDEERRYRMADGVVSRGQLSHALPAAIGKLKQLNANLLMGYYEGFTLVELAARYELTLCNVKMRVHRARRRVKQLLMRDLGELVEKTNERGGDVSPRITKRKGRKRA